MTLAQSRRAIEPANKSTQTMSLIPTFMIPLVPTLKSVRLLPILLLVLPALAACGESRSQPQAAAPPPQVTIAKPVSKMIADQDEYVGRFVAVESVEVRARVPGYLAAIHFQDGQMVKAGDLLFTIDRRPFQIALAQAQASLAQAKATLAFAESDLARAEGVAIGTVITQQAFDQRMQAKRVAEAAVAAQDAAASQAALDLEFTELRAPVSGRIGDRRVSIGNLVTGGTSGNTSLLATIESIDPIRFEFTLDEASYLRFRMEGSRPACLRGFGRRPQRPRMSCSCPMPPSGPSRCASSFWWLMPRTLLGRNTSRWGRSSMGCASSRRA
jgi:multidrug efflux pump subunit AcrA (membrane-fusion protein)